MNRPTTRLRGPAAHHDASRRNHPMCQCRGYPQPPPTAWTNQAADTATLQWQHCPEMTWNLHRSVYHLNLVLLSLIVNIWLGPEQTKMKKVHFSSFNFHTSSLLVPNVSIGPKETLNFTNPIKCLGLLIFLRKKEKNKSDWKPRWKYPTFRKNKSYRASFN
jgi:hypothetical protein